MRKFKTLELAIEEVPGDQEHQLLYYISDPLTLNQWIALDDAMEDAFEKAGVDPDSVIGIAGPIPFDEDEENLKVDEGETVSLDQLMGEVYE